MLLFTNEMTLEIGLKCYQQFLVENCMVRLFIFCNLSGQIFLYIWRQNFIFFKYAPKTKPYLQSSRLMLKQGCVGTTGFYKFIYSRIATCNDEDKHNIQRTQKCTFELHKKKVKHPMFFFKWQMIRQWSRDYWPDNLKNTMVTY